MYYCNSSCNPRLAGIIVIAIVIAIVIIAIVTAIINSYYRSYYNSYYNSYTQESFLRGFVSVTIHYYVLLLSYLLVVVYLCHRLYVFIGISPEDQSERFLVCGC